MANVGALYYSFVPQKPSSGAVSDYNKTGTQTVDGMSWTVPGNWYATASLRVGGKSITAVDRAIIAQSAMGDAISKIIIKHKGTSSNDITVNSISLFIADNADFTDAVEIVNDNPSITKQVEGEVSFGNSDYWPTGSYYKIVFNVTNTTGSNRFLELVGIDFYSYQDPTQPYISAENVDFGMCLTQTGSYSEAKTLDVVGGNLSSPITYEVLGSNISVSGNLTAAGGQLTVVFSARAEGEYSDTIVLSSGNASQAVAVSANVIKTSGNGTQDDPFTVADVVKLNNNMPMSEKYWVQGYILGCAANSGKLATSFTSSNIALGDAIDQTENTVPVELPSGDIRTALNLSDHAGNVGKQVKVHGQLVSYFSYMGVKAVDNYEMAPVLADGYYLVGNFNDWTPDANYLLTENTSATAGGEYMIDTVFAEHDSLKVFWKEGGDKVWYPADADNYVIPAAGSYTIYFRPDYRGGDDWYYGCIYAAAQSVTPVEPEVAFYLNNNWDGVQEWSEKEMVYDESTTAYYLNGVVFGGTGVDLIKKENGKQVEKKWYPIEKIDGREITGAPMELMALDTVDFFFSVVDGDTSLVAMIIGPVARPVTYDYYLVGNFNGWDAMADYALVENATAAGEYMIENVRLSAKDSLKVMGAAAGQDPVWFPDPGENYVVAETGVYDIYFRPDYKGGQDWHYGCIYVAKQAQAGCDWASLEWLGGPADYANQFKVCKADGEKPGVVNIQNPAWTDKTQMGIYTTFPSAAFGNISLDEAMYEKQGAGILFFLSAFTAKETEVTVVCDNNPIVFTVYNDKGIEDVPEVKYYLKNNWGGGQDWTWKEMTNVEEGMYLLENVVFGGTGVNYSTSNADDQPEPAFIPVAEFNGEEIGALDTVGLMLILTGTKPSISVSIIGKYQKPAEPVIEYYLVGDKLSKWEPKQEYKLTENAAAAGEYMINDVRMGVGDSIKVIRVVDGATAEWYPANAGNLVIGVAGTYSVYFRPDYQGGSDWYQGCIYLTNPIVEMAKVYVVNRLGWEAVYAYVFNSTTGNELQTWPGVLLRQLAGAQVPARYAKEQVYEYEFPSNYDKIIFNNGKEGQEAAQTIDLTWTKEDPYYMLEGDKNSEGKYEGEWAKTPTDIDNIDAETTAIKVLQNGQIFIIKAGHIYNLTGQIVK